MNPASTPASASLQGSQSIPKNDLKNTTESRVPPMIEELPVPNEPFSAAQLQNLYDNGQRIHQNPVEAIAYIEKYWYKHAERGEFFFLDIFETTVQDDQTFISHEFRVKDKQHFKEEVVNICRSDKFVARNFDETTRLFHPISDINKPRIYRVAAVGFTLLYVNTCSGFLFRNPRDYDSFSDEIKEGVQFMLEFIRTAICDENEEFFKHFLYYLNWICHGKQTQVIMYLKGAQGIGKTTFMNFLTQFVLGWNLCATGTKENLTTQFNISLMSKLVGVFEELPMMSKHEWDAADSALKTLADAKMMAYRDLFKAAIRVANFINLFVLSNHNPLKDTGEARRIIIALLSVRYERNKEYFAELNQKCMNLEVGEAFFSYIRTRIHVPSNWRPQHDFPMTDMKRNEISKYMNSVKKYLKFLVLNKIDKGTIKAADFYKDYVRYCDEETVNQKPVSVFDFGQNLKELGIEPRKSNTMVYDIFLKETTIGKRHLEGLEKLAERKHWISEWDSVCDEESETSQPATVSDLLTRVVDLTNQLAGKDDRIAALQKELENIRIQTSPLVVGLQAAAVAKTPAGRIIRECCVEDCHSTARFGHLHPSHCSSHMEEGMSNFLDTPVEERREQAAKKKKIIKVSSLQPTRTPPQQELDMDAYFASPLAEEDAIQLEPEEL